MRCSSCRGIARSWPPEQETILLVVRLPRVVAAALVGAALATAGALFQGLLRNPLADPYVVGTSGGAAIGAVVAMLAGGGATLAGFGLVPPAAFLGATQLNATVSCNGSPLSGTFTYTLNP